MALLEIKEINKLFGGLSAIRKVSFGVEKGEICGIIGPNGAGKTTLFNLITGIYRLDGGEILFSGKRLSGLKPHQITATGIARTFQKIRLFANLTVAQNVHIGQHCRTRAEVMATLWLGKKTRAEEKAIQEKSLELLKFVNLDNKRDELARNLSYGEQRLLEIARAMAPDPSLILLDEPSSGLNSFETDQLIERIQLLNDQDITIVLIEHDMNVVMGSTRHIIVLNFGEKIFDGSPQDCRKAPEVIKAYLGQEYAAC